MPCINSLLNVLGCQEMRELEVKEMIELAKTEIYNMKNKKINNL